MDLYKTIRQLYEEKKRLDLVIAGLEELERATASGLVATPKKRRGRKHMDAKARKEVSERMKRYWAQRRAEKGHSKG